MTSKGALALGQLRDGIEQIQQPRVDRVHVAGAVVAQVQVHRVQHLRHIVSAVPVDAFHGLAGVQVVAATRNETGPGWRAEARTGPSRNSGPPQDPRSPSAPRPMVSTARRLNIKQVVPSCSPPPAFRRDEDTLCGSRRSSAAVLRCGNPLHQELIPAVGIGAEIGRAVRADKGSPVEQEDRDRLCSGARTVSPPAMVWSMVSGVHFASPSIRALASTTGFSSRTQPWLS